MTTFVQQARKHFEALMPQSLYGYFAETLVFSYLRDSPVIRGVEFAVADGAIYLSDFPPGLLNSEKIEIAKLNTKPDCCINFDVKIRRLREGSSSNNKVTTGHCWNSLYPSRFQRAECAFTINVFLTKEARDLTNTTWVALIPIHLYYGLVSKPQLVYNNVYLWSVVDPAWAPYAFPAAFLPVAISNVRKAVLTSEPYKNPWSLVELRAWKPMVNSSQFVCSRLNLSELPRNEVSENALDSLKLAIKGTKGFLRYETNDVQPLLGDFILIGPDSKEYLFEHKMNLFTEHANIVEFHLQNRSPGRNPFHPRRLWDFILWQSDKTNVSYCIPRNRVPRDFCISNSPSCSIARQEFKQWRLITDSSGHWLEKMYHKIVVPYYGDPLVDPELLAAAHEELAVLVDSSDENSGEMERPDGTGDEQEQEDIREDATLAVGQWRLGHRSMRGHGLHGLICLLQDLCARDGSGVFLPLWQHSPWGDYVFIDWAWTREEQQEYWHSRKPPVDLLDRRLKPQTTVCLLLVTAVFYHELHGGMLSAPTMLHSFGSKDPRNDYFLVRPKDYILLGDPSPEPLSAGLLNTSHPYLFIPSDQLQLAPLATLANAKSLRYWLEKCRDPYEFALPLADIHRILTEMMDVTRTSVRYNQHAARINPLIYKQLLINIWQAHVNAAEVDARNVESGKVRSKHRCLSKADAQDAS